MIIVSNYVCNVTKYFELVMELIVFDLRKETRAQLDPCSEDSDRLQREPVVWTS